MSIASRINEIIDHIGDIYDTLEIGGAISVDKNIINIHTTFRSQLLDWMNNGTDELWNNWEKVIGEGTSITLNQTIEAPMRLSLKGNASQKTTTGKNLFDKNNITYDMLRIYENTSAGATRIVSSDTSACVYIQISPNSEKFSISGMGKSYNVAALTSVPVDGGGDAVYTWTFRNTQTGNYTTPSLPSSCTYLAIFFTPGDSTIAEVVENLQIEKNASATPYEEYTGGIPAPNPGFPMDINVVSGDNSIVVCGKNLLNPSYLITANANNTYSGYGFLSFKLNVDLGQYTISRENNTMYNDGGYLCIGTGSNLTEAYTNKRWMMHPSISTLNVKKQTITNTGELWLFTSATQTGIDNMLLRAGYLQLEKGTTATTYEPYTGASYPISLGVENLLNSNINKTTINGITFTPIYNDDSTLKYIVANGTASANVYFTLGNVNVKANTSYLLSGCPANDGSNAYRLYAYMYDSNNTYLNVAIDYGYGNGITFSNADLDHIQVGFTITSGKTINNFKIYPMVELGTTKHSYTPYGKAIELCKIGTYQDKIDKSTGKNLFDYNSFEAFATSLKYVTLNLKPNTQYTLSSNIPASTADISTNLFILNSTDSPNSTINGVNPTTPRTATTNADGIIKIGYRDIQSNLTNEATTYWYMLNEGTTALPYEPYGTNWYVKKEIGKVVLNGSESWYQWGADTFYITRLSTIRTGLSNYYKYNTTVTGASQLNNGEFFIHDSANNNVVIFRNTSITTVADFKTWLGTHNTTVYYVLATPTYETITDNNLISQLEAIKSCTGQTVITQTQEIAGEQIELEATALKEV